MVKVLVEFGEVTRIAKLMGITRKTVGKALSGKKNNPLAQRICKLAIERGGVEINSINSKKQ